MHMTVSDQCSLGDHLQVRWLARSTSLMLRARMCCHTASMNSALSGLHVLLGPVKPDGQEVRISRCCDDLQTPTRICTVNSYDVAGEAVAG